MNDTRLNQITALVDDARTLTAELMDDLPTGDPNRLILCSARIELNSVIDAVNLLTEF